MMGCPQELNFHENPSDHAADRRMMKLSMCSRSLDKPYLTKLIDTDLSSVLGESEVVWAKLLAVGRMKLGDLVLKYLILLVLLPSMLSLADGCNVLSYSIAVDKEVDSIGCMPFC